MEESARRLHERAGEHMRDCRDKVGDSHMFKHCMAVHHQGDQEQPEFEIRLVKHCSLALERQIGEATRILLKKNVLNSEY